MYRVRFLVGSLFGKWILLKWSSLGVLGLGDLGFHCSGTHRTGNFPVWDRVFKEVVFHIVVIIPIDLQDLEQSTIKILISLKIRDVFTNFHTDRPSSKWIDILMYAAGMLDAAGCGQRKSIVVAILGEDYVPQWICFGWNYYDELWHWYHPLVILLRSVARAM